ncbi:hypothetical protein RBB78_04285 [Tunturiibacter empetritectus]|uniref:hypothetical protein n=1 Tax=Tunturiibacter empetritectus TaxID=3069691 RepID=UPI003D9BD543
MGMKLPRIKFGRPQQLAALLLLVFLAECLWVVSRQQLSQQDYRYAECGREMWERPSPARRLLHHLRQSQRRRHLCVSRSRLSPYRAAAGDARRG